MFLVVDHTSWQNCFPVVFSSLDLQRGKVSMWGSLLAKRLKATRRSDVFTPCLAPIRLDEYVGHCTTTCAFIQSKCRQFAPCCKHDALRAMQCPFHYSSGHSIYKPKHTIRRNTSVAALWIRTTSLLDSAR